MRILITNDDGIESPGIIRLAKAASKFGEVIVAAPDGQCSAMSHRITISDGILVREEKKFTAWVKAVNIGQEKAGDEPSATIDVSNKVSAYRISGTPADCVKIAIEYLLDEKPDVVLSGINKGFNAGIDIEYSGTVAAAMEGLLKGIPAIALSKAYDEDYDLTDARLEEILEAILQKPAGEGKIWNVNFPECKPDECQGILWNREIAKADIHPDVYGVVEEKEDGKVLKLVNTRREEFEEGTDLRALQQKYISIGTITSMILG